MALKTILIPPPTGDSVSDLSDDQLWNAQLLVTLACSRAKSSITRRREAYFCYLGRVLKVEADLRGLPSPSSSDRTHQLRRQAL